MLSVFGIVRVEIHIVETKKMWHFTENAHDVLARMFPSDKVTITPQIFECSFRCKKNGSELKIWTTFQACDCQQFINFCGEIWVSWWHESHVKNLSHHHHQKCFVGIEYNINILRLAMNENKSKRKFYDPTIFSINE